MPPQDIGSFATWFGSSAVVGAVIGYLTSNWPWLQKQGDGTRTAILFGIALGMGLISQLALTYIPAGVQADLQPYYKTALSAAILVFGQQIWERKIHDSSNKG